MSSGREIRVLTKAEVETLLDWAAGEGWNPGLHDAAAFYAADPSGFFGAFVGGEMIAGISAVAYGDGYGFIGLYICRPDMRGKGHGKAVWNAGMARLGKRTIGLDGVDQQVGNYRSMGFAPVYRTIRYSGRLDAVHVAGDVRPVGPDLITDIVAFDSRFFPAPRAAFLDRWLRAPHVALAAMHDRSVAGYGVARPCREGWKIGPLFAEDNEDANNLLVALTPSVGSSDVHLDVPEPASRFSDFLRLAGLTPGFATTRMYRGSAVPALEKPPYAVTSLELG